MKQLSAFLILLISTASYGQNWSLFPNHSTYHFNSSDIHSLHVDSIKTRGTDTLIYFNPILNDTIAGNYAFRISDTSVNLVKPNIYGEVVIQLSDTIKLLNHLSDTIRIAVNSPKDSVWTVFKTPNQSITAMVDTIYTDSINGILDSIKRVVFKKYDKNGNAVNHVIDSVRLTYSKYNGIIETTNFYQFPDHLNTDYYPKIYQRIFIDLNKTISDVFGYEVGDEFHIVENDRSVRPPNYPNPPDYYNVEVISKQVFGLSDSVRYTLKYRREENTMVFDQQSGMLISNQKISNYNRTIKYFNLHEDYEVQLGKTPIFLSDSLAIMAKIRVDGYNGRVKYYFNRMYFPKNDTKVGKIISWYVDFPNNRANVISGVCTYWNEWEWINPSNFTQINRDLIYFKKGNEVWGNKRLIVSLNEINRKGNFNISPNPTKGEIYVPQVENLNSIQLYNMQGQLVTSVRPQSNSPTSIQIEGVPGMYFVQLQFKDGSVESRKIIKQ